MEVGGQKSEVGSQKSEVGSRRSEVGGQKSEVGSRRGGDGHDWHIFVKQKCASLARPQRRNGKLNLFYINPKLFNSFSKFSCPACVISTKGNLGLPTLKPNLLRPALTGIGLTSLNKALVKGKVSNCNSIAS